MFFWDGFLDRFGGMTESAFRRLEVLSHEGNLNTLGTDDGKRL